MRDPEQDGKPEKWEFATWEGARLDHLRLALSATPAQRLAWVEEALMLAHRSGALKRLRDEEARELEKKFRP